MDQLCACACGFQSALDHQPTTHVANQTLHTRICTSHSTLCVIHLIFSLHILQTLQLHIEHCTQRNVGGGAGRRDSITILIPTPTMGVPYIRGGRITCEELNPIDHWIIFDFFCVSKSRVSLDPDFVLVLGSVFQSFSHSAIQSTKGCHQN